MSAYPRNVYKGPLHESWDLFCANVKSNVVETRTCADQAEYEAARDEGFMEAAELMTPVDGEAPVVEPAVKPDKPAKAPKAAKPPKAKPGPKAK